MNEIAVKSTPSDIPKSASTQNPIWILQESIQSFLVHTDDK